MEGRAMVSSFTGPMNSLVDKLTKLETNLPEIGELLEDLVSFKEGFFEKVAWRQETDAQVRAWMNHVREVLYKIEDRVDAELVMMEGQELEIEEEIKKFKAQIEQARELCERYNLVIKMPTHTRVASSGTTHDYPLLFEKKTRLFSVLDPTNELLEHLTAAEEETMLKVVSILGMEGLGKTTLAKEVYANLQGQFECQAFVTLGQRPSMRAALLEILRQVKLAISSHKKKVKRNTKPKGGSRTAQDLEEVITELWEYLAPKRYLIFLDGLWSTRAWKVVNCALPNKNRGSRVLITTCISDVAKCCSIRPNDVLYHMKGLRDWNSVRLDQEFREEQRPAYLHVLSSNMSEMCGGLPLVITVTDGLLAMMSEATESKMFEKSSLSSVDQYSSSERMTKILQMSYDDLSEPLKSCLLYLSIFREDYDIKKDRLIRLWLAEGFIPRRNEEISWKTGESYFDELIIRRLIQPSFDNDDDKATGCTVHGVILNFIRSLSSQSNFVTVRADLSSGIFPGSTNMIRRFSLDCYDENEDGTLASSTVHLSRVRSLTVLGDIEGTGAGRSVLTVSGKIKGKPVLPSFKLIRVLDLEDTDHLRSRHLQGIGGLVLLRYLGLGGTGIDELPQEIGKLEQLETLDLRHTTNLSILPASIAKLKMLVHLLIGGTVKLPSKILKMRGLQEVSTIGVHRSRSINSVVELLRESEQLRVLGVRLNGLHLSHGRSVWSFFQEVARSTKLISLSLDCLHFGLSGLLLELAPCHQLRRFELTISDPLLGRDIHNMASLVSITHMDIKITELEYQAVQVLGNLPNVVLLKLVSSGINSPSRNGIQGRCIVSADGFQRLKVFSFKCQFDGMELFFTPGAMRELRRLSLSFNARETLSLFGNFYFGIEHLSSLTRVHATINCKSATASDVKHAEDAITEQVRVGNFYMKPTTQFSKTHQHMMLDDGVKIKKTTPGNIIDKVTSYGRKKVAPPVVV